MAYIWIVEDDPQIALLIKMAVQKDGHEALHMLDAAEMEKELRKSTPDLMLLDLMLRAKNGFQVLKEWKERPLTKDIPVIILSARAAERDKVQGLDLGAEDYITKPFSVRELQARIRTALRRMPSENERIVIGALTLIPACREVYVDGARVDLTQKEFEVLCCLARCNGQTVTRGQLLQSVWGYDNDEDPSRTVDSHIKTLRLKIGDPALTPRFIQTVRGTGYRLIAGETV